MRRMEGWAGCVRRRGLVFGAREAYNRGHRGRVCEILGGGMESQLAVAVRWPSGPSQRDRNLRKEMGT